ncbi:hypothetical protein BIV57_21430, partial [Mangrovactinospora gilvigrisea]
PAPRVTADPVYAAPASTADPTAYVDPFAGTRPSPAGRGSGTGDGGGHTFPGAAAPYGMLQWSPDTSMHPDGGGYDYRDTAVTGFGLTHLSGPGCPSGGQAALLPVTGGAGDSGEATASVPFAHADESAAPGRYAVRLGNGTAVRLAAATRAGTGTVAFPPRAKRPALLLNLDSPQRKLLRTTLHYHGRTGVSGSVTTTGFCGTAHSGHPATLYFSYALSAPFTARTLRTTGTGPGGALLSLPAAARGVTVRVGVSLTSEAEAAANRRAEADGRSTAQLAAAAHTAWRRRLGAVTTEGGTAARRATLYTALYHACLDPSVASDADGRYRGFDGRVHRLPPGRAAHYTNFSGWDIYRSQAQLTALLDPRRASDMAQSLVDDAEQDPSGTLPRWAADTADARVMPGDSAIAVLAAYYAFGARDFDTAAALRLAARQQKAATPATPGADDPGADGDDYPAPVSTQLEYRVDDLALARLAAATGHRALAAEFTARAGRWRLLTDTRARLLRPGAHPADLDRDWDAYAQASAVTQTAGLGTLDPAALAALRGGPAAARRYLDGLLAPGGTAGGDRADLGNEPGLAVPWLYAAPPIDRPDLAARHLAEIADRQWRAAPDGIPGNDDLGELSSWYVWAALGRYPLLPGTGPDRLVTARPLFPRITVGPLTARAPASPAPRARRPACPRGGDPLGLALPAAPLTGHGRCHALVTDRTNRPARLD